MLGISDSFDPLLRRPFSIFRKTSEGFQFLYEIRGKGTMMMKGLRPDTVMNVLGPLGNGYPEPEDNKISLLVAGGVGIASLFSLAEALGKRAYIFYGARARDVLIMLDTLKGLTDELFISTDDGSMGKKGTVIDALDDFLTHHSSASGGLISRYMLYACGPKPMLVALSRIVFEKGIKGYVSVEENMACGFGACLGCAVRVRSQKSKVKSKRVKDLNSALGTQHSALTYKMVCKEGPVFPIEEIVW